MLAIRLQRTGRSGHAQFRLIVQDSRFSPTSGRVVTFLGSYNPHTKVAQIDKDKISEYLKNGAQPSDRVARLLQKEGIKLPSWVKLDAPKQREVRYPEKLRKNRPVGAPEPAAETETTEAPVEEAKDTQDVVTAEQADQNVASNEQPQATEEENTEDKQADAEVSNNETTDQIEAAAPAKEPSAPEPEGENVSGTTEPEAAAAEEASENKSTEPSA